MPRIAIVHSTGGLLALLGLGALFSRAWIPGLVLVVTGIVIFSLGGLLNNSNESTDDEATDNIRQ